MGAFSKFINGGKAAGGGVATPPHIIAVSPQSTNRPLNAAHGGGHNFLHVFNVANSSNT